MRYFLLTCCVVLVSARPEARFQYDPLHSSQNGAKSLSCCQRLALLQKHHGSETNQINSYGEVLPGNLLSSQTAPRILVGPSSGFNSGYSTNTINTGYTPNGYPTNGHSNLNSGGHTSTSAYNTLGSAPINVLSPDNSASGLSSDLTSTSTLNGPTASNNFNTGSEGHVHNENKFTGQSLTNNSLSFNDFYLKAF